jgi:tetratricopeptide (TPR) repeat protein
MPVKIEPPAPKAEKTGGDISCPAGPRDREIEHAMEQGIEALKTGDFKRGAEILYGARSSLPACRQGLLDQPLAAAHMGIGKIALERELWTEASASFEKAASLTPLSPAPHFMLGQLAESLGDTKKARTEYREAARLGPDERTLERLYEIAYAANETAEAAELASKLLEITHGADQWRRKAGRMAREGPVETSMQDRVDERFTIRYDGLENADAAFAVQEALADAFIKLTRELGTRPSGPVTVILYTKEQFHDITHAPAWSGGIFDGKIRLPAGGMTRSGGPLLRRIVFHEFVHILVSVRSHGNCPVWLNEGLAEYFSGLANGAPNGGNGKWDTAVLRALEGSFMQIPSRLVGGAYETSRAAVAYIVSEKGGNSILHILDALAGGSDTKEALRGVGLSYGD